jgi:hypothetical protein
MSSFQKWACLERRWQPFSKALISSLLILPMILGAGCSRSYSPAGSTHSSTAPDQSTTPIDSSSPLALKVIVRVDGIYRIQDTDLRAAGLPSDQVNLQNASLSLRGKPVPVWLQNENNAWSLYFYGRSSDSLYSAENIYWLQLNGGTPDLMDEAVVPATTSAAGSQLSETYTSTLRTEQQIIYSPTVSDGDHWFWASIPAPKSQDFDITLTQLAVDQEAQSKLVVNLYGSTEASQNPDHHAQVLVNGHQIIDERWDGQGWRNLEGSIPDGVLKEGKNQVRITLPKDIGVPAEIVLINWIEVVYNRNLISEGDRLEFSSIGRPQNLADFSGPVNVFDISAIDHVERWPSVLSPVNINLVFRGEAGHRYLAIGPQGFLSPEGFAKANLLPDLKTNGGADYIAIGPPDLLAPLKPLVDWRQKQGLKVLVIPLAAVYDQFNFGMSEPQAIRSLLDYAHQNWQPAPRYVLLVGDATFDPRGYTAPPDANRLPSYFVYTSYGGETTSDVLFSQLTENASPQIALGRVPARQPDQVKTFVDKVLAYEQTNTPADWRGRVLAVADGQDPSFHQDAESFLDQLPQNEKKDLYSPEAGVKEAARQVKSYFMDGYLLIAYFGHGSLNMWGKDHILTTADVETLTKQNSLPIVFNFTCLNGLFTHPIVESMAEGLLFQQGGGAVSVLAPTSLTLPADQSFLINSLAESLAKRPALTLGEAFLFAQQQIPTDSPGSREVLETFLLFGDPALRIAWTSQ